MRPGGEGAGWALCILPVGRPARGADSGGGRRAPAGCRRPGGGVPPVYGRRDHRGRSKTVSRGEVQTIEVPIGGMCCADEAQEVQRAISALPGVASVDVLLASERAIIRYDPAWVGLPAVERAVEGVGCSVPAAAAAHPEPPHVRGFGRAVLSMFGAVIGVVLFVVVGGEWLGLYETITDQVPWP